MKKLLVSFAIGLSADQDVTTFTESGLIKAQKDAYYRTFNQTINKSIDLKLWGYYLFLISEYTPYLGTF